MEEWEKEHILNNLVPLIETTMCNRSLITNLMQRKLLTSQEEEELESYGKNSDKNYFLYKTMQTRCGGYNGMMEASINTGQNGVYAILQRGVKRSRLESGNEDSLEQSLRTDQKWEKFLHDHELIYFVPDASKLAIDDLTHRFYTDELNHRLKNYKYYSPHVLSAMHAHTSKIMLNVYSKEANRLQIEQPIPIHKTLEQSYKQFRTNYMLTLNGNRNFNQTPAIGIDLGTCNLCSAVCVQGRVTIFRNSAGEPTTPSYVSFEENGKINIGKIARKFAHENPTFTIYDSKRMIGKTFNDETLKADRKHWPFRVNDVDNIPIIVTRDKGYVPEEISTLLIKECKAQAEKALNQIVTKAVITVPAYFNNSQREATAKAGREAGLEVLKILNEPTAAAITYRQERYYDSAKLALVFDIGGGTFDVALVKINGEEIVTLGTGGDTHLGGEDFDRKVMEHCIGEFKKSSGINLNEWKTEADVKRNRAFLQFQCEEAKKDLSSAEEVIISVPCTTEGAYENLKVILTRSTFESLCMPLFEKMLAIVDKLLKSNNISKDEIEDIILVGGSTRIPKLQQMLQEYFGGKELNSSINQDHAVAYGAAVQAAILNGEEVQKLLNINKIVDAIPMSIGIQCVKDEVHGQFSRIIEKDSKYPRKYWQSYVTQKDDQENATIRVFQGEQDNAADNFYIGMFRFEGIPKAKKGMESIDVCMEIDDMGILQVTASCKGKADTKKLTAVLLESSGLRYHLDKRGASFELECKSKDLDQAVETEFGE